MIPARILETRPLPNAAAGRTRGETVYLALALASAGAVALGFGRFGYALVLPAMRQDLGWTYRAAGLMNTVNALGYLAGAASTAAVLRRTDNRAVLLCGLAASVFALFLAGWVRTFSALLLCRALVGAAGAFVFISASGLAARLGRDESENALAMGISIAGPGFGTIATGLLVPFALGNSVARWPRAWLIMGALGLVVWVMLLFITRTFEGRENTPVQTAPLQTATTQEIPAAEKTNIDFSSLRPALLAYFLFGVGYIAYMTFLVAYVRSLKAGGGTVAMVWTILGCAMASSALVWKSALARNTGGRTLAAMAGIAAVCALLPLLSPALPVLLFSAIGFGLATMPVFTAVGMLMRRHLPPPSWNGAFARATVIFAVGQSLGPFISGALSDRFGLTAPLWWTAALLFAAALVALRQPPHASSENYS